MSDSFHFEHLQHFTAGTIGPKGQRTFYLQFGNAGELVSLKVEKGQVSALAEFFDQLLEELDPLPDGEIPLALDLIDPVEAAWAVASIGVAHQTGDGLFAMVIEELVIEDDEGEGEGEEEEIEPATAEVRLTQGQVQAFVGRARELLSSGRPPCDFCGRPLDHADGWCPCHN
jgi:uncharacterized repeat protein (TIGR03847 family)